jgi:NADH-quinone oxidoreductase subunit J
MIYVFFIISALLLGFGVGVVLSRNPLHSALFLTFHLTGVAALYAMMEAHFLALAQLIVYSGAIIVLVVFVIMLLNIKEEPLPRSSANVIYWLCGGAAALSLLLILIPVIHDYFSFFVDPYEAPVGSAIAFGRIIFTDYVFAFELSALLLTAAVVGAVMIARQSTQVEGEGERQK